MKSALQTTLRLSGPSFVTKILPLSAAMVVGNGGPDFWKVAPDVGLEPTPRSRWTVLVPTDGSEIAERAVKYGTTLAGHLKAALHCCYVVDYVTGPTFLTTSRATGAPDLQRNDGRRALAAAENLIIRRSITPHSHLIDGHAVEGILKCAAEISANIIVVGTHGRSGVERAALGSTAEGLARSSPIPVITVSPSFQELDRPAFQRVVVAVDGSAPSQRAAQVAFEIAQQCGASVDLCYVIDPHRVTPETYDDAKSLGTELLEAESMRASKLRVVAAQHIIEGSIAARLLHFAMTFQAEMIAIGTHGRTGVERMIFGSVAESLLRESPLPVLVVR